MNQDLTKEDIKKFISEASKHVYEIELAKAGRGSKENPWICIVSRIIYNLAKAEAPNFLDENDMYYSNTIEYQGWVKVIVYDPNEKSIENGHKVAISSRYGVICGHVGHVNKPSYQEFMDAKYKRKNFAKDYLMKGKKW